MKLWASNDHMQSFLTDTEKKREELFLRKTLDTLENDLDQTVRESITSVKTALNEHIHAVFNESIPLVSGAAYATASGWGAHRSLERLYWATYKATVRKDGVYSGASGPRNFNQ